MKKLAVLTSGGDSPGMNACIRAVVRSSIYYGIEVIGVKRGYEGLIHKDFEVMDASSVGDIVHKGGTILKTARSKAFMTEEGRNQAIKHLKEEGIEGLIVIGGDGSFKGAAKLSEAGIATIGIPGTIDNDLAYTDYTIGFDTAVNTVLDSISKIRDTSTSHEKATIIEVMGRHCGDIAMYAGVAGGAEAIIIPEKPFSLPSIIEKMEHGRKRGKQHHIIILAEGSSKAEDLRQQLVDATGEDARISVLGFIQRGGDPSAFDRVLASRLGLKAVELLKEGEGKLALGVRQNQLVFEDIHEALSKEKSYDPELDRLAEILSI
ncbi:6-phosphofructokinase [Paenalkalicoccus suaedae]|uniref:ATP-dependent 6-phosphofructokinase n=1 Tax=Paenalkalicoccus suaedae TaxID=2592382 RepID=A0A859FEA2_9BACI|nr:6-phosphofructokinase [Paenalkalicoccus suaedae]QKS71178.1 6-phosphofructokinase [Paenalkalicoccus suaedae]